MITKKKTILEKVICGLVILLMLSFFLVEMLMKPLSGEDIVQQQCMTFLGGWNAFSKCVESTMDSVPRIGQVAHYVVVWKFHILPHFGFETIVRIIDGLMSFGIVYMIAMMARGGKRLRLNYETAIAMGASFIILVLSTAFSGIFFNGFSNVHNYVPAVFFTLLFGYLWFWRKGLAEKIGNGWMHGLLLVSGFLFAVSTELNSLVFFALVICVGIVELCRSKDRKATLERWKVYIGGIVGVILGFIFIYIIGNGFGATVGRSDNGYLGAMSISELLSDPITAVPILFGNAVSNFYSYLPYLLLAIAGVFVLFKQVKDKTKNKDTNNWALLKTAFIGIICYTVAYIAFCSPTDSVMWRLTAVAFCSLLIPIVYLMVHMIEYSAWAKLKGVVAWGVLIFVALLNVDNFMFMLKLDAETNQMITEVLEEGCLSRERIESTALPMKTQLFRLNHAETALTYTDTDWYGNIYLINGDAWEIREACSEEQE